MSAPPPVVDARRRAEFRAELQAHARAALGGAEPAAGADDWLAALLEIVARMESEVTRRLDRVPEKQQRNFVNWLGKKPRAARAARLAAVFKAALGAKPLTAPARVKLQAQGVVFETDQDLTILPGAIQALVAVAGDRIMLPPPGLFDPAAPPPDAVARQLVTLASADAVQLQVTPALGLKPDDLIRVGGAEYRVVEVKGDLVTIDPPLEAEAAEDAPVEQVTNFAPVFGTGGADAATPLYCCVEGKSEAAPAEAGAGAAAAAPAGAPRDWQLHELYLGDDQLLSITGPAEIEVISDPPLTGVEWRYFGKSDKDAAAAWSKPLAAESAAPDTLSLAQGSIETGAVDAVSSRWLRARSAAGQDLKVRNIRLKITSPPVSSFEAVANAAPVSSLTDFFPLGAEPRLFDSFYLGSAEAFSKAGAEVTVHITVPTATLGPLAPAPFNPGDDAAFFAVGVDGLLYRVVEPATGGGLTWTPLSRPKDGQVALAGADPGTPLQPGASAPIVAAPGVAPYLGSLAVAAPAKGSGEVWLWRNDDWASLGEATAGAAPAKDAGAARLRVDGTDLKVLVLRDQRLFEAVACTAGATPNPVQWSEVDLAGQTVDAVLLHGATSIVALSEGRVTAFAGGVATPLGPADLLAKASALDLGVRQVYAAVTAAGELLVFDTTPAAPHKISLGGVTILGDIGLVATPAGAPMAVFATDEAAGHRLGIWQPASNGEIAYLDLGGGHAPAQGPVPIGTAPGPLTPPALVLPGDKADLAKVEFTDASVAIAAGSPPNRLADRAIVDPPAGWSLIEFSDGAGNRAYADATQAVAFPQGAGPDLLALPLPPFIATHWRALSKVGEGDGSVFVAAGPAPPSLTPDPALPPPKLDDVIDAQNERRLVLNDVVAAEPTAALDPALTGANGDAVHYTHYQPAAGGGAVVIQTVVDLTDNPPLAEQIARAGVIYTADPLASPPFQGVAGESHAGHLLLKARWSPAPRPVSGQYLFQLTPSALQTEWQTYNAPANPALSWEYWNGTGWWALQVKETTGNLRRDGDIVFTVPGDLAKTDVIGKTNYWIRARLVGGDYGHETFKLKNEPGPPGSQTTVQSIERDTSTVRPPRILSLTIGYAGPAAEPKYVLTHDNLGWRDQSDANRSDAVMAVFQTFSAALADSRPASGAAAAANGEDPCACGRAPSAPAQAAGTGASAGAASNDGDGLYIGFDTAVVPGSVRLYLDVADQAQAQLLRVAALREGVFVDAGPTDETDGLAQSGQLTLALDHETTAASLFGQTLHWIRVGVTQAGAVWTPMVRRLYLNAAWASAAETQEPEVMGSADGSPNQVYSLTRFPVLPGSLELRVRETLDEDQVKDLVDADPDKVRVDPPGFRTGAWVRWDEVGDPLDAAADARVYALDEATGEVRFGDAAHGRAPPPDVDNIAAFTYRRGGGSAANGIAAGQAVQLTSPLAGVEAVTVGAESAGGADVADAKTTLERAAPDLWARARAVSLRDLEQLALDSGPEIVQARSEALGSGGARVVVVTAGSDPRPDRRACNELAAYLAAQAGPALQGGRLQVQAPGLRPVKLSLELVVADKDHTGAVRAGAAKALADLFDPVAGGWDGRGWPLGAAPTDADIAGALVNAPGVLAVSAVSRLTQAGAPFPDRLPLSALVTFDPADLDIAWQIDP